MSSCPSVIFFANFSFYKTFLTLTNFNDSTNFLLIHSFIFVNKNTFIKIVNFIFHHSHIAFTFIFHLSLPTSHDISQMVRVLKTVIFNKQKKGLNHHLGIIKRGARKKEIHSLCRQMADDFYDSLER
jgi:hypothetical protein